MTAADKKFRVAEIFGPTIQGEGRHAGIPCYFIRFGGCDYRCSWCDSPHAVLPDLVSRLPQMTAWEITNALRQLPSLPDWIVLSGGNPGLLDLQSLVTRLHSFKYKVMMETQGSTWREWYSDLDEVCFSPKPPSSGMDDSNNRVTFARVIQMWESKAYDISRAYIKVVVFDEIDYVYARAIHETYSEYDFFISAGNEDPYLPTVANPHSFASLGPIESTQEVVLDKMRWLFEKVANDPNMANVRVMPQLHTLAWGNARGR